MKIFISIATFIRPEGLSKTLESIRHLAIPEGADIQVVVADNDPLGSAEQVCKTLFDCYPFPLHYFVVKNRGISFVRNSLAGFAVTHHGDFIAFIDDDEFPEPYWLTEMLSVQSTYRADLVGGPVFRVFPEGTPSWAKKLCFFETRKVKSGLTSQNLDSGNLVIAAPVFSRHKISFDNEFAVTGGEDAMFSKKARNAGLRLAWAGSANVYESVPADRLRPSWLAARSFRIGTITVMMENRLARPGAGIVRSLGKVFFYLGAGLIAGLASFGIIPYQRHRSLIFLSRAAGLICGLLGVKARMPDPDRSF